MTYTLSYGISLGPDHAGLTLTAQLVDTAGSDVGASVSTGFVEISDGNYLWTYASIPDSHRGGVKFFSNAGSQLEAFGAVNPVESEPNALADAILDRAAGVETGRTLRQSLRLMLASLAGKLSGAATTTVTIRDTNDTKDRILATVDSNGNRTATTYDVT